MEPRKNRRKGKQRRIRKQPILVIAVFILIWIIGIATGEPGRILEQAKQVCLSCIGIG